MMIVERLINRLMQTENNTGKKQLAIRIVRDAFEIITRRPSAIPLKCSLKQSATPVPEKKQSA